GGTSAGNRAAGDEGGTSACNRAARYQGTTRARDRTSGDEGPARGAGGTAGGTPGRSPRARRSAAERHPAARRSCCRSVHEGAGQLGPFALRCRARLCLATTIAGPKRYPAGRFPLVEIEVSDRLRNRFLARLTQRLFEPLRQRVAARFLVVDRLLEDRFAPGGLLRENPLRFGQLRLVGALRLLVRHDPAKVRVDHERRLAARTCDLELRFQPCHQRFPPPSARASPYSLNSFLSSRGLPSGSVAVSFRSRICALRQSNRWPKPAVIVSSVAVKRLPAAIFGVRMR